MVSSNWAERLPSRVVAVQSSFQWMRLLAPILIIGSVKSKQRQSAIERSTSAKQRKREENDAPMVKMLPSFMIPGILDFP